MRTALFVLTMVGCGIGVFLLIFALFQPNMEQSVRDAGLAIAFAFIIVPYIFARSFAEIRRK